MVLYLPLDRDRGQVAELSPKLVPGVWLGLERSTNEAKIGTPSGVIRARTVRRRPEAERWSSEAIRSVIGVPWDPTPGVISSEMKTAALVPGEEGGIVDMAPEEAPVARRLKLSKNDFLFIGYTVGCNGCQALRLKGRAQNHSEVCRQRVEAELRQTPAGRARLEKQEHRLAETITRISENNELQNRGRVHGSTEGSPPGTDEAGRGEDEHIKKRPRPPPSRNPRRYRWTCRGHLPVACCPIRKMQVSQTLEAARGGQTATTMRGTRWFVKRRCKDRESRGHQMRSPRWQRSCIVQGSPAAADGT